MKKTFTILATLILLALSSCANIFRDELAELHGKMDEILALVDKANSNLEAVHTLLEAVEKYDYISSITPITENGVEVGYNIIFTQSGLVTIYHGRSPQLGSKEDVDGIWYWTIDGEWLLDNNGAKVMATGHAGITPILKIENDRWFISYDNGNNWNDLGKSVGNDGDSMFREIIVTEGEVIFMMMDGNEFAIPKNPRVRIILDIPEKETGVLPGSEIQINYTLENATDSTFVTASSNGYYGVRVEEYDNAHGRVIVTSPYKYVDGYINIMVSDGASYSFIKVISFYEHKMELYDGMEYYISPHGGEVVIPFSTNFEYRFEVDESSKEWISISYYETRSEMRDGILSVVAEMNDYEYARMGKISVIPTNSTGDMYAEIIINQASAYFSIDQSMYAVPVEGATIATNIISSRGLKIDIPANAEDWLHAYVEDLGDDNYRVITTIFENETSLKRAAMIDLYSSDGDINLGSLEFVQASPIEEEIGNMVFKVRANWSNDFIAYLPIAGYYDCYIDWGDGQAEYIIGGNEWAEYENAGIYHKYNVEEPTTFTVRISGTVTSLESEGIKPPCITEVVQWGKTGLQYLSGAFQNNNLLTKVCDDPYKALSGLTDLNHIFYRCSSLEKIPEDIFKNCVNATSANHTFHGCSSLKIIPENLFSECRNMQIFEGTFTDCIGLTSIPSKLFANNPNITHAVHTFEGCENIAAIPDELFSNNTALEFAYRTFCACDNIKEIPENLFVNNPAIKDFYGLFQDCNGLISVPEGLFRNNKEVNSFNDTFNNCDSLQTIPAGIFDNNRKVTNFSGTLGWNYNLTGESPYTIIDGVKYHLYERHLNPDHFVKPLDYTHCFAECYNLIEWETMQGTKWFNAWE